jgi:hypothetical protein
MLRLNAKETDWKYVVEELGGGKLLQIFAMKRFVGYRYHERL